MSSMIFRHPDISQLCDQIASCDVIFIISLLSVDPYRTSMPERPCITYDMMLYRIHVIETKQTYLFNDYNGCFNI